MDICSSYLKKYSIHRCHSWTADTFSMWGMPTLPTPRHENFQTLAHRVNKAALVEGPLVFLTSTWQLGSPGSRVGIASRQDELVKTTFHTTRRVPPTTETHGTLLQPIYKRNIQQNQNTTCDLQLGLPPLRKEATEVI